MIRTFLRRIILTPFIPVIYFMMIPLMYLLTNDSIHEIVREANHVATDFWNGCP